MPPSVWAAAVLLLLLTVMLTKARRNYLALPELPLSPTSADASLATVVIPARNESANIGACVGSFAGTRVIVVDDDSNDGTAEVARAAGAEVIAAPPVHPGYKGKPNALIAGAAQVKTDYVLFADADTRFDPAFLASAVHYATAEQLVLTTAFLRQECITLAEQMLVPYALALYFAGVDASAVNDGRAKDALANGQCMLFLRQPYEFVGGHRPVHKSVIEDVEMAHTMKRHRMKMRVLRAEHLGTVRMYDSLAAIWRGFRKNAFLFLRLDARLAAQVIVTSILLTSIGPVALWLASSNQWLVLGALLVWPAVLLRSWYSGWLGPLLYLPAIYVFQAIALHGMASALFGWDARWKGRRV